MHDIREFNLTTKFISIWVTMNSKVDLLQDDDSLGSEDKKDSVARSGKKRTTIIGTYVHCARNWEECTSNKESSAQQTDRHRRLIFNVSPLFVIFKLMKTSKLDNLVKML